MEIIKEKINLKLLQASAGQNFSGLIKAVVDIEKGVMAVGGDLHSDEEALLIKDGSNQYDLWGINLYPDKGRSEFIEFDSMINIRPVQDNKTRGIDSPAVRDKVIKVVNNLIKHE